MPDKEARQSPSLLNMQEMRAENGPSLPLACYLRRPPELQALLAVPHLPVFFLLDMFRRFCDLGLEGNPRRRRIYRVVDARELRIARRALRYHWPCHHRIHRLASVA